MVYFTHRLLQSLQVVLLITTQCQLYATNPLTLTPGDLDAVVGRWNKNFTCVLDRTRLAQCNASLLHFTYEIVPKKMNVPLVYVRNISHSEIELRHFPEIEARIGTDAARFITCRCNEFYKTAEVRIMKRHENPQIKDIIVENWDTLSFAWERTKGGKLWTMTYKAWYWNSSNDSYPLECNQSEDGVCKVRNPFEVAYHADVLFIKVNGSTNIYCC